MDAKRRDELLMILRDRFLANAGRHEGLEWSRVASSYYDARGFRASLLV